MSDNYKTTSSHTFEHRTMSFIRLELHYCCSIVYHVSKVYLTIKLEACRVLNLIVCVSVCMSVCVYVCVCVYMSVCVCVICVSVCICLCFYCCVCASVCAIHGRYHLLYICVIMCLVLLQQMVNQVLSGRLEYWDSIIRCNQLVYVYTIEVSVE